MKNEITIAGDLSKSANLLIEKVSGIFGGAFAPWQIKRVARAKAEAEVEAEIIRAHGAIRVSDIQRRAAIRWFNEEAQRQANIEEITAKAIPHLADNAAPDQMDNDWVTNFFDKSRLISDEQMQELWAKILAGEASRKGSFSRRTVNAIADLDKFDAEQFANLCRFVWQRASLPTPVIMNLSDPIYIENHVNFDCVQHLKAIGLITTAEVGSYTLTYHPDIPKNLPPPRLAFPVSYFGKTFTLNPGFLPELELPVGKVLFSKTGEELATVCQVTPIDGFFEYMRASWQRYIDES